MSILTRHDRLTLESFPLHTEKPQWAAQAPAQVSAACQRGAHLIGLTETRGPKMVECQAIAAFHGYGWYGSPHDAHRNVTVLVKHGLHVVGHVVALVANNYRVQVAVDFHGSEVSVFQMHWEPNPFSRQEQTHSLIKAMIHASHGKTLSFYMGDSNPSKAQHLPGSEPGTMLLKAGMPTIYQELGHYPPGVGVNMIGHNKADTRVKAKSATVHPALGSDHVPVTAVYSIQRLKRKERVT